MGRDEDVWGVVGEEFLPEMDDGIRSRSTQELKRPQLGLRFGDGPCRSWSINTHTTFPLGKPAHPHVSLRGGTRAFPSCTELPQINTRQLEQRKMELVL